MFDVQRHTRMTRSLLLSSTALEFSPEYIDVKGDAGNIIADIQRGMQMAQCSRPLLFNLGDGSPLTTWRSGTAFAIRYTRFGSFAREFLVTARHCLGNLSHQITSDDLNKFWIFKSGTPSKEINHTTLIPLLAHHPAPDRDEGGIFNEDDMDFEIFEVMPGSFENEPSVFELKAGPLELNEGTVQKHRSHDGDVLAISGFPTLHNTIDYDTGEIIHHRMHLYGLYTSRSIGHFHGAIRFPSSVDIPGDMDGFSGSPVFGFADGIPKLAGMVTRSTSKGRIAHFIGIELILMRLMFIDVATAGWFDDQMRRPESTVT